MPRNTERYIKNNRYRIVQLAVCSAIILVGVGWVYAGFPSNIIVPLLIGLAVPATVTEPFFSGPRSAFVSAIAVIGSYFAIGRVGDPALWICVLVISIVTLSSAIITMCSNGRASEATNWIATRLGRTPVVGALLAAILLLHIYKTDPENAPGMTLVVAALCVTLFLDWNNFSKRLQKNVGTIVTIETAVAPNQLLISTSEYLEPGSRVEIQGPSGSSSGHIIEALASKIGARYRLVLSKHWTSVTQKGGVDVLMTPQEKDDDSPTAFAIEGTTESSLRVMPTEKMDLGDTYKIDSGEKTYLYQVSGSNLEFDRWQNSEALVPRVELAAIGALGNQETISPVPFLPNPYEPVFLASNTTMKLTDEYMKLGRLKGTDIPIGIRKDWQANFGHLAILGMSGMGKTTTASRLINLATDDDNFLVLDGTGEYQTYLGFDKVEQSGVDWNLSGKSVCNPGGDPPVKCEQIIRAAMEAASIEYHSGILPRRRYILLEESHSWLPEWNVCASQNQKDAVHASCRYILQARKFNISFVLVSQRTAVISKSALSQCENYIIFRTLDQTGMEYLESVIGTGLKKVIGKLARYEAICVGPLFNVSSPVIVALDPAIPLPGVELNLASAETEDLEETAKL